MAASIRDRQIAALKRMLNFNVPVTKASSMEPQWKILVYDRIGQDIISPLLSVMELRDMGVTLHLMLHSDREAIPDVPVLYFAMPTEYNIQRITRDMQGGMYEAYYFNFISAVPRQQLEDLAAGAVQAGAVTSITKVFDQYLNFITLEDDLFTVRHQDRESINYYAINRGGVKDTEIEGIMDTIVSSLFCLCVTLGSVPIIRCPRGNAAQLVSEKLDRKLRDNLRDARNSLFTGPDPLNTGHFSFQRPLLVILDRNQDLATPMHHTWTYQALAHDVFNLALNRVELEEVGGDAPSPHQGARPVKKKKSYDITQTDKFWHAQKGSPFPVVAESVQEEIDFIKTKEEEIKRLKSAMGLEGDDEAAAVGMLNDNTAKLTSAVSSLPELLERKRLIDMHTNIATAMLEHIKHRKLDVYFETEEKMLGKATLDKSLMDIISDPDAGTTEDKMRLFLISLICGPPISEAEIEQYSAALEAAGCDLAPVQYVRRWKSYSKTAPSQYGGGGTTTLSMFSKLMSDGSKFVMEGVKNLAVKNHKLPVTRLTDNLMELKTGSETDEYLYLDPKMMRQESSVPRARTPFQEAIVFVIGGGNYIEYQNLSDYMKAKTGKRVIYGCTDLVNASQFMKQLCELGREMH